MIYINNYHRMKILRKIQRKVYSIRDSSLIQRNKKGKILVVLHLFYLEALEEILEYLKNFEPYEWSLIITCPSFFKNKIEINRILSVNSSAKVLFFENKGYDIGPFMQLLNVINFDEYDVVFKLQSKGVKRKKIYIYHQLFFGRQWFVNLFEGCVGANVIHKTINRLLSNKEVGLIAADNLIVNDPPYKEKIVQNVLKEKKLLFCNNYKFVAGTCFAIKGSILKELADKKYISEDFEDLAPETGMSLAHVLERYFTIYVNKKGYLIEGNNVSVIKRFLTKPLEKILERISSERLLYEQYEIDDYFFHKYLDNKFIIYHEKQVCINDLSISIEFENNQKTNEKIALSETTFNHRSIYRNNLNKKEIIIVNSHNVILSRADLLKTKLDIHDSSSNISVLEIKFITKNGIQ